MKTFLLCAVVWLASCTMAADDIVKAEPVKPEEVYNEQYRPQFHFSPLKNWMNDPNGMVFTVSSLATR